MASAGLACGAGPALALPAECQMTALNPPIPFAELLATAALRDDGFALDIPPGWLQGRTAYGGCSAALAFEAARRLGGEGLPPLRSGSIAFVGPLAGQVEVRARVLRRGRNATWITAEVLRAGEVGLSATFVFMGAVPSEVAFDTATVPSGVILPEGGVPVAFRPDTPQFVHAFERCYSLPPVVERRPDVCWWVRVRDRAGLDPMTELVLMADAMPPAFTPLARGRPVVSSMIWQINLLTPAPVTTDGWWLSRSVADHAEQGCSSQQMSLWNHALAPVVSGMQSVAIFG